MRPWTAGQNRFSFRTLQSIQINLEHLVGLAESYHYGTFQLPGVRRTRMSSGFLRAACGKPA